MAIFNSYFDITRPGIPCYAPGHASSSRRQQGSMGAQSQEGSLYMTEERFQKIRIAAATRRLTWAALQKKERGELSWNELKNGNIYIYRDR